ncbi:hypothetical protein EP10_002363 [Geobacillus icigianus]|uniref:Uncharacterized protein n=1 Tax=Geobacillus icigianus TaxID=1430331 RepID=A0ABU6BHP1_9BACL|nr:hypothetical protein [Geobacillus icigianus]
MKKNKYSVFDHIFAITVVSFMCLAIISLPFLLFYSVMHLISLTNDVRINSSGTFSSIKIILKFFLTVLVITGVVDTIFSLILKRMKGIIGFLSEAFLMLAFFYLYVLIYCFVSNEIVMTDKGRLYVSLFLFLMYLSIHAVYIGSKHIYESMVKK